MVVVRWRVWRGRERADNDPNERDHDRAIVRCQPASHKGLSQRIDGSSNNMARLADELFLCNNSSRCRLFDLGRANRIRAPTRIT